MNVRVSKWKYYHFAPSSNNGKGMSDTKQFSDCKEFKLWRGRTISINTSVVTFRITQFLWHGAGCLPTTFFGIFLKQRGLTLVELSSVFSFIFLFTLLSSLIAGIIADKIGNAKPILMFLMLLTTCVLFSIWITPNINSESCIQQQNTLNDYNITLNEKKFSSCYIACLHNNKYISVKQNVTQNSVFENTSSVELFGLQIQNSKNYCNFSIISLRNISLDSLQNRCCQECTNSSTIDCVTVRAGYLVIVYAILILAFYSGFVTTYRFMDFAIVSLAAKTSSYYGKEFAFGVCGNLLIMIIVAFVLNIDKSSGPEINYNPVILIAAGIQFCAFLTMFMTAIPILPPCKNLLKNASSLLSDIDILAFILLAFLAGNALSFDTTFRLIFLETISAPSIVVALHSVAVILYGFPTLLTSNWWLENLGANKIFVLSLLFYTTDFIAFSYIQNSWWTLILDVTVAFSVHLFLAAVVVHSRNVAPEGFAATFNALTGTVHFGMGRSSGVFFGGMLMNYMGPRKAYRIMAAIVFATAILYSIFLIIRRKSPKNNNTMNGNATTELKNSKDADIQDAKRKLAELTNAQTIHM